MEKLGEMSLAGAALLKHETDNFLEEGRVMLERLLRCFDLGGGGLRLKDTGRG